MISSPRPTPTPKPTPTPWTAPGTRPLDIAGHTITPAVQIGVVALLLAFAAYCLITNRMVRHLGRLMVCLSVAAIAAAVAVGWADRNKHAMLVLQASASPAHDWPVLRTLLYAWVALTVLTGLALFVLSTLVIRRKARRTAYPPVRRGRAARPPRGGRRGRGRGAPAPGPGGPRGMPGRAPLMPPGGMGQQPGMAPLDLAGLERLDLGDFR